MTDATPDFYKVLGVAKDATPEQIKHAWRRASSAAHPDRDGGSPERQQAVNKAYEVLGDPERRADYDKHGIDHDAMAIEEEGRMQLMDLFAKAATDEQLLDIVAHLTSVLHSRIAECKAEIDSAHRIVASLQRVRRRVKVKKPGMPNMFHAVVDKKIERTQGTIPQNQRLIRVVQASLKFLADYATDDDAFDTRAMGGHNRIGGVPMRWFIGGPPR